ncbi:MULTISPECIES: O-antigen ligase family protein [unclassified Luteococcus]|uniref:O-antigen ligase family protein n=1 Tax=unclassified Luteococcus TaxID=2639923 RepID=UPI00313EAEAE
MSTAVQHPRARTSGWGSRAGLDVTAIFTGYVILLFAIPATMVVEALGTLGAPATILSLLALGWYTWHHLHRAEPLQGGPSPVRRAGILLALVMLLVYGHAMTTFIPGFELTNADTSLLRLLGLIGLMLVLNDGINSIDRWRVMLNRLSIAGAAVALLAILQFFTNDLLIDRMSIPGLTPPTGATVGTRGMFTRPSASATNAIEFGAVIAMFLPIAFTNAQTAVRHRLWRWLPVGLMAFAALVSLSRTAIICVVIGMAILVPAWSRRAQLQVLLAAPVGLVAAGVAVPGLLGTLRGLFLGAGDDTSVHSRTDSYGVAWQYILRHPWLGRGYNTFLPRYWILDNAYLQILIGTGIVGTLALFYLIFNAARSARTAQRLFRDPADALAARSLLAAVVAGSVSLFFFDAFSFPQSAGCVMLVYGLAGASLRLARLSPEKTRAEV